MGGNNFNSRGRGNSVEVNRTPIELTDENYVSQAEAVIKRLIDENGKNKILTTSKIRKLLAMISDMYTKAKRLKSNTLNSDLLTKIQYFKMHTVYEAGRESSVKKFVEEAQITNQIDKIKTDREKLILFCHYMEALVAYRKFLGGRDE
ncbi:type III-A CRISPR-associated protein Csm2 [Lachnoanaerobaculum gingivalis]|jgi:CRISPR-associated protein, csm2 family|uniref:type III-A CRISPR-associated protein Csm2 n=1 Tax=Lachnoanaerobaculum gingivalis TaxID=2490855 RepID=UPI0024A79E69|nr:type III-A CRISPR-associated protein Csm2 [Lachnoanaerobaculum gingivalis]WHE86576.1 type III-A CRISPR-associated protein Csm2 [Lachnoanaerobaculum gingivalis]